MKVPYPDYDGKIVEIEVPDNIGSFILNDRRQEANQSKKERRHCYSLDAKVYEGIDYAAQDYVEEDYENSINTKEFYRVLYSLTETQKRRALMLWEGLSLREIAREEGVNLSAIQNTVAQLQKKFENVRKTGWSKTPPNVRIVRSKRNLNTEERRKNDD